MDACRFFIGFGNYIKSFWNPLIENHHLIGQSKIPPELNDYVDR